MAAEWQMRAGLEADVPAMYALDCLCFDAPFRFTEPAMRRFAQQRGAVVVVAELAGKLAGFIIVHPVKRGPAVVGYVVTLDIAPEFRRRGLASELMRVGEEIAVENGSKTMTLHVDPANAGAVAFYEGMDYRRVRLVKEFYGQGLPALVYEKTLKPASSGA